MRSERPTVAIRAAMAEKVDALPHGTRKTHAGRIESADRAELPARCACCGDTLDLHAFRTLPGRVRYFVCREHLVSAIARLGVGMIMLVIATWAIAGGSVSGLKPRAAFALIGLGGAAMAWFAVPVRAGRSRAGWRTIHGLCKATADEVR